MDPAFIYEARETNTTIAIWAIAIVMVRGREMLITWRIALKLILAVRAGKKPCSQIIGS